VYNLAQSFQRHGYASGASSTADSIVESIAKRTVAEQRSSGVCLVRKDFLIGGAGIFTYSTALAAKESSQIWIKGISLAKTGLCHQTFLPCAWEEYF